MKLTRQYSGPASKAFWARINCSVPELYMAAVVLQSAEEIVLRSLESSLEAQAHAAKKPKARKR